MSKTTTATAEKVVTESLAKIRESATASTVFKRESVAWTPKNKKGSAFRQGDVMLLTIPIEWLKGQQPIEAPEGTPQRQVAEGNTQGSRHILTGNCQIFVKHGLKWDKLNKVLPKPFSIQLDEMIGPAFISAENTVLEHPEHANVELPEGYAFVCIYQQCYQDAVRKVRD
jgi:hypothetical protein